MKECVYCGRIDNRTKSGRSSCYKCRNWKNVFGIDHEIYNEILEDQDYQCAICGCTKEENTVRKCYLAVDHCHDTMQIRGLLCSRCNQGIGLLDHSVENLSKAIHYLENNATPYYKPTRN